MSSNLLQPPTKLIHTHIKLKTYIIQFMLISSVEMCERMRRDPKSGRSKGARASEQFESPKWRDHVRGITRWERRERERERRGALTTNILFLVDRMSRFKWCAVRSCLDVLNPGFTLPP